MDDTISRLAVIQIIEKMRARIGHNLERSVGRAMIEILDEVGEDVEKLPSALGTNLAEVGTDCISRQAAIDALDCINGVEEVLRSIPSAQPEIIRCRECKFASGDSRICMKFDHSPIGELDFCSKKYIVGDIWELTGAEIREVIDSQPTIQPEIIRCKDCKHWIPYDWMFSEIWQSKNIADYPEDEIGCDCCDMAMKANDFCSRAERRTE